ncbi:phenylalanine--tRNA ligase subunit alpha [Buchnera aphidicola]|uniref:phenylalanine--tRNA ligase subunit alpha n=1 Tax=Buchnera aphidicola TaxID=9 RepID=UPI003464B255
MIFNKSKFLSFFNVELKKIKNIQDLERLRVKYLGKQGIIVVEIKKIKYLQLSDRKHIGKMINDIKNMINKNIINKKLQLDKYKIKKNIDIDKIDVSLPGRRKNIGTMHPITKVIYQIESIFCNLGFNIINKNLEIENQYYNFDALNIPIFHPARNIQDTFWFDSNRLLRTQTSNMQIHEIEKKILPIKIIIPGKVYRRDYDQTHSPMFHQVEGLVIDKNITFSNLKWVIVNFLNIFFNQHMKIRFRSSYFPFTVLSSEVDIMSNKNNWLEVLGCGMVHPNILHRFGIDTDVYSGFAFGLGVERMVMLYYGINDLRVLLKNDLKFLQQFKRSRYF